MTSTVRTAILVTLVLLIGAGLFLGGMFFAGRRYSPWGGGMMGGYGYTNGNYYGPGMMGSNGYGNPDGGSYGPGMMGGYSGMMGGGGMMGGYGGNSLYGVQPLTLDEAESAVTAYLAGLKDDDLALHEIMVFDNNAYAIVIERSTGVGAFELLVDPVNRAVFPEHGPNMMWNLKYGTMSGYGGYGMMGPGMMGGAYGFGTNAAAPEISAEMPVSAEQAAQAAQEYLALPGTVVTDEVTPFYGYYTIDIARDGDIVGMLSVNGYTRQVFFHSWHGDFIEMSEAVH